MAPPPASPRGPPRFAVVAIVFAALLVVAAGVLLAPVVHRILHSVHCDLE